MMVCPRCQQAFEQQLQCPDCGCKLLYQADNLEATPVTAGDPVDHWQRTPWGRIVAGLLLAMGLSFGLQQLCTAGVLAGVDAGGPGLWGTLWGLVLLLILQG